jgi:hypothetical protein
MEYHSASDLFGNYRLIQQTGKPLNERSLLVKYFCDNLKRAPKYMGIRLAHYSIDQLYALQSAYKDRLTRSGRSTADKYFWYITKTVDKPLQD